MSVVRLSRILLLCLFIVLKSNVASSRSSLNSVSIAESVKRNDDFNARTLSVKHNGTTSSEDYSKATECDGCDFQYSSRFPQNETMTMVPTDSSGDFISSDGEDDDLPSLPTSEDMYYHRWGGIDILVAVFFVVAAGWLLLAIMYSAVVLVLLRLQARGELDFYDENFGLMVCCDGRLRLHFGCILRRYAIQLEREQHQQHRRQMRRQRRQAGTGAPSLSDAAASSDREGDYPGDGHYDDNMHRRVRIMTRAERRTAMEWILTNGSSTNADTNISANLSTSTCSGESQDAICNTSKKTNTANTTVASASVIPFGDAESDCSEGPVCTVCLCEYQPNDQIFQPTTCSHLFHKDCIMDWLERRQNTDCPCCRQPIVSDEEVWEIVKKFRKARRKQLQRENGILHRIIKWIFQNRNKHNEDDDVDDEDDGNNQSNNHDEDGGGSVDNGNSIHLALSAPSVLHPLENYIEASNQGEQQQHERAQPLLRLGEEMSSNDALGDAADEIEGVDIFSTPSGRLTHEAFNYIHNFNSEPSNGDRFNEDTIKYDRSTQEQDATRRDVDCQEVSVSDHLCQIQHEEAAGVGSKEVAENAQKKKVNNHYSNDTESCTNHEMGDQEKANSNQSSSSQLEHELTPSSNLNL